MVWIITLRRHTAWQDLCDLQPSCEAPMTSCFHWARCRCRGNRTQTASCCRQGDYPWCVHCLCPGRGYIRCSGNSSYCRHGRVGRDWTVKCHSSYFIISQQRVSHQSRRHIKLTEQRKPSEGSSVSPEETLKLNVLLFTNHRSFVHYYILLCVLDPLK